MKDHWYVIPVGLALHYMGHEPPEDPDDDFDIAFNMNNGDMQLLIVKPPHQKDPCG